MLLLQYLILLSLVSVAHQVDVINTTVFTVFYVEHWNRVSGGSWSWLAGSAFPLNSIYWISLIRLWGEQFRNDNILPGKGFQPHTPFKGMTYMIFCHKYWKIPLSPTPNLAWKTSITCYPSKATYHILFCWYILFPLLTDDWKSPALHWHIPHSQWDSAGQPSKQRFLYNMCK